MKIFLHRWLYFFNETAMHLIWISVFSFISGCWRERLQSWGLSCSFGAISQFQLSRYRHQLKILQTLQILVFYDSFVFIRCEVQLQQPFYFICWSMIMWNNVINVEHHHKTIPIIWLFAQVTILFQLWSLNNLYMMNMKVWWLWVQVARNAMVLFFI